MHTANTPTQLSDLNRTCTTLTKSQISALRQWPGFGPDRRMQAKAIGRQFLTVGSKVNVLVLMSLSKAYECRTDNYEAVVTNWYKDGSFQLTHTYANGKECKLRVSAEYSHYDVTGEHVMKVTVYGKYKYSIYSYYITAFEQPEQAQTARPAKTQTTTQLDLFA